VNGLFDFRYKQPLSRQRENYLVNFLERQELQEVMKTKSITDSVLSGVMPTQEIIEGAINSIKDYVQMALPSKPQKGKMVEDLEKVKSNKDELKSVRDRLKIAKVKSKDKAHAVE
jgi:hypothetical protein